MSRNVRAEDLLDLMETLLQAQLETIQEIRRVQTAEDDTDFLGGSQKRPSHAQMAYEVLVAAGGPLHIGEITKRVRQAFGVFMTREVLASVVLRDVKIGRRFVKTGPNTYDVLGRDRS